MSGWFPFEYRDVTAWKNEGLPISTPSHEAAKFLDAAVAQLVLADTDPNEGGMMPSMKRALAADPECHLGQILSMEFEAQDALAMKSDAMKKTVLKYREKSHKIPMSSWESRHLDAALALSDKDWLTACQVWEDILVQHPKDIAALHLLYFGNLHTGRRRGLRDSVARVVDHYKPQDRYYGHLQGKLCFGYGENNQYDLGFQAGTIALEHTPRDIWAIHAMAHVYDETNRDEDGIAFLERTESDWVNNSNTLRRHVWWHKALFYFDLGQYDEALSLYDMTIEPLATKEKLAFGMSDAASLLLRFQMVSSAKGIDLSDRWRELGQVYKESLSHSIENVFYDFHPLVTLLFSGEREAALKLKEEILDQAKGLVDRPTHYTCMVSAKVGLGLCEGAIAYVDQDYAATVKHLNPIRYDVFELLGASHAQKDVIHLLLLDAAMKDGQTQLAEQLLAERFAWSGSKPSSDDLTLNNRICGRDPRQSVACHKIVLISLSRVCRAWLTADHDVLQFADLDSTRITDFVTALYAGLGQTSEDSWASGLDPEIWRAFDIQAQFGLPEAVENVIKGLEAGAAAQAVNIETHLRLKYQDSEPVYEFHVKDEPHDFHLDPEDDDDDDDDYIAVHDADRFDDDWPEDLADSPAHFRPPLSPKEQLGREAVLYVRGLLRVPGHETTREKKQRLAKWRVFKRRMEAGEAITKQSKHPLHGLHLGDLDLDSAERIRRILGQQDVRLRSDRRRREARSLSDLMNPPPFETAKERRSRMITLAARKRKLAKDENRSPNKPIKRIKYIDDDEDEAVKTETKDESSDSEASSADLEEKKAKKPAEVILGAGDSSKVTEALRQNLAWVQRRGEPEQPIDVPVTIQMIHAGQGQLPIQVTTPALRHEGQIGRSIPMLTSFRHEHLALMGIAVDEAGVIRGKPLAWSEPDHKLQVMAHFEQSYQAFSRVYGLPEAVILNSRCILSHQEWDGEPRGNSFADLYKRLFNTATRPELERELEDPVLVAGTTPPVATYSRIQLPLSDWSLHIDPHLAHFQEIVVVGVYPHTIDCKRIARIEDPAMFAFLCMRILYLVWGKGNGKFKIRLDDSLIDKYMEMGRLIYRKQSCEKLLASEGDLPRPLPVRTCDVCGITITENSNLSKWSRHQLQHTIETYQCACDVVMNSFMDRKRHYKSHHHGKNGLPLEDPNANIKPIIMRRPHSKRFNHICESCGLECTDNNELGKHVAVCNGIVQCQICQEKFYGLEKYYEHMKNMHEGKFDQTKYAYFFSNHSKFKQFKKKISCDQCPKTFVDPVVFKKHWAQIHGSEADRPYKCAECEKSFVNKANLKEHLLSVHIRSRPFVCRYEGCKSDFNCSANLYAHEKKVHGEKRGPALSIHKVITDEQMLQYSYILGNDA
eukprot:maker-scaffold1335_size46909-snap-gene-0.13 protein:Tk00655 transcript:maker-scaffold1335_size46909-snap-gene-0.13-mRNA-1 annotation:"predicted protein"